MVQNRSFQATFILLSALLVIFIGYPILLTVTGSDPQTLLEAILDETVLRSILFTLSSSLIATGLGFITGIPLAYLLAHHDFRGKRLIEGLIDLPIVIPHSAAGIALLLALGRNTLLGKTFNLLGVSFISSAPGVVAAMLFVSVPFLIDSAREGFKAIDPHLESVARTLGSSPWKVFWKVSFPLAWQGILSGLILMWSRGISEFGAVVILAYHPMIAPVLLFERYQSFGLDYALPVAGVVILISMLIFIVLRWISSRAVRK